jgi:hypothetical protein
MLLERLSTSYKPRSQRPRFFRDRKVRLLGMPGSARRNRLLKMNYSPTFTEEVYDTLTDKTKRNAGKSYE